MKGWFLSLILPLVLFFTAYPSYAGDDREDRKWNRDKEEQRHYLPAGKPFRKIIKAIKALEERVAALEEENSKLKSRLACASTESDEYDVFLEGEPNNRTGSHNLVVSPEHT